LEAPEISKANSTASSSQQVRQFAVPIFSVFFTTFKPAQRFTFNRTQFTAPPNLPSVKKGNCVAT